ncbi:MAG: hypothetical protein U0798_15870 [Gemmataceae bacterium]
MATLICPLCLASMRTPTEVVVGTATCPNCKHRWVPTSKTAPASASSSPPKVVRAIPVAKASSGSVGVAKAIRIPAKPGEPLKPRGGANLWAIVVPGVVVVSLLIGVTIALVYWNQKSDAKPTANPGGDSEQKANSINPDDNDKPDEEKSTVTALIAQLANKSERNQAVEAMTAMGAEARAAVVPLLQSLDGRDSAYERLVERALHQIGRVPYLPTPTIQSGLTSKSVVAVQYVLDWIAQEPRASSEWLPSVKDLLSHPEAGIREKALLACAAIGSAAREQVLTQAIQALGDDDPRVRRGATKALEVFRPFTRNDLSKLAQTSKSSNAEVRLFTITTILAIVDSAENVEKYVVPFLRDTSAEIVTAAIKGLMNWAPVANRNMIDILPLMSHESRSIRADTLELVGALPKSATSTNALTRTMRYDADEKLREAACLKLERQIQNDPADVNTLSDIMTYGTKSVRKSCLEKIAKIGPDAIVLLPQLTSDLRNPDFAIRTAALNAIIALKTDSKTVIDIYVEIIAAGPPGKDEKDAAEFRMAAARALAKMGQKGIEELVRYAKTSNDPDFFRFVNEQLRVSKWRPESTVAWLLKIVTDKPNDRKEAGATLAVIADSEAVRGLLERTEFIPFDGPQDGPNNPGEIRAMAIQILGDMDWKTMEKADRDSIISRLRFMAVKERDGRNMKLAKEILNKHRVTVEP